MGLSPGDKLCTVGGQWVAIARIDIAYVVGEDGRSRDFGGKYVPTGGAGRNAVNIFDFDMDVPPMRQDPAPSASPFAGPATPNVILGMDEVGDAEEAMLDHAWLELLKHPDAATW
jgi:hypothetical protein